MSSIQHILAVNKVQPCAKPHGVLSYGLIFLLGYIYIYILIVILHQNVNDDWWYVDDWYSHSFLRGVRFKISVG